MKSAWNFSKSFSVAFSISKILLFGTPSKRTVYLIFLWSSLTSERFFTSSFLPVTLSYFSLVMIAANLKQLSKSSCYWCLLGSSNSRCIDSKSPLKLSKIFLAPWSISFLFLSSIWAFLFLISDCSTTLMISFSNSLLFMCFYFTLAFVNILLRISSKD